MVVGTVVVSAAVVVVVLGVAYWLAMRRGLFGGPEETEATTEERMQKQTDPSTRRLGMADRVQSQSPLVKGLIAAFVCFVLFVFFNLYRFASTGSASTLFYLSEIQWIASGTILFYVGTWFQRHQDGKAGELVVKYENADEEKEHSETLYYDREKARRTEDGETWLPVLKERRPLGLFWTPKLVADDPERRHAEERLPTDQIIVAVAEDGSTAWHRDAEKVVVRAKDKQPQKGDRTVDFRIVPSDRKSASEVQSMKNEMEELEQKLDQRKIEVGILTEKIMDLRGIAEQSRSSAHKELQEVTGTLANIVERVNSNDAQNQQRNGVDQRSAIPTPEEGGD